MTDNEIIKALECLTGESIPCKDCPYSANYTHFNCQRQVAKDALDLINRQKAEYNNLLEQFRILDCECERLEKADENQQAEIERLKAHINEVADKVEDKMTYMSGCQNLIQTVKKIILGDETPFESLCDNCGLCKEREEEAVKEFAERLKARIIEDFLKYNTDTTIGYIDNLVKEMAGDE